VPDDQVEQLINDGIEAHNSARNVQPVQPVQPTAAPTAMGSSVQYIPQSSTKRYAPTASMAVSNKRSSLSPQSKASRIFQATGHSEPNKSSTPTSSPANSPITVGKSKKLWEPAPQFRAENRMEVENSDSRTSLSSHSPISPVTQVAGKFYESSKEKHPGPLQLPVTTPDASLHAESNKLDTHSSSTQEQEDTAEPTPDIEPYTARLEISSSSKIPNTSEYGNCASAENLPTLETSLQNIESVDKKAEVSTKWPVPTPAPPKTELARQSPPQASSSKPRQKTQIPLWIITREPRYTEERWDDGRFMGTPLPTFIEGISKVTQRGHIEKIKLTLRAPTFDTKITVFKDAEDSWASAKETFIEKLKEAKVEARAKRNLEPVAFKILVEPFYEEGSLQSGSIDEDEEEFEF